MEAVKNKNRSRLVAAAMQKIPCDLTVENSTFVNVITGETGAGKSVIIEAVSMALGARADSE